MPKGINVINRLLLLLVVLMPLVTDIETSIRADEPLFRAAAQVAFGDDIGQDFGTLFEVQDDTGRVILGAGFPSVFNTCVRLDRFALQFYVRPNQAVKPEKELLPRPSAIAHQSIQDRDGHLFSWTYHLDKTLRRWDAHAKLWREDAILDKETNRFGDGFMSLAGKPLVFQNGRATYDGQLILPRPENGEYATFYYALGHMFFYHSIRSDKVGFTKVMAAPWIPGQERVDVVGAKVLNARVPNETTFAWGQLNGQVLTVSNYGNIYVFDGQEWRVLRENEPNKSYQVYSAVNFRGDLLLGHYPSGRLLRFDGTSLAEIADWPPVMPGVANYSREAQSTMLYRGDLYVGVWPWAELWRYDHDSQNWSLESRMFSQPALTDLSGHPYQKDIEELNRANKTAVVINEWGQRICGLAPWRNSLMIATSAKGPMPHNRSLPFLTDAVYAEYGRVWRYHLPGHLTAPLSYKPGRTKVQCLLQLDRLQVWQDDKLVAESIIDAGLLADLKPTKIVWGEGLFGRASCKLIEKESNLKRTDK
ncbi:MAG: hypothetical protein ABL921_21055 [Pirellula sp.]